MAADLDAILFAALERWWQANREPLMGRGVTTPLQGPLEAPGMDPVYFLRLGSDRREAEASLFHGGILLLASFDKRTAEIENSSIEATAGDDLIAALTGFAERA
jgi:hypothetical protein